MMSASLTAKTEEKKRIRQTQGTQRFLNPASDSISFSDNDYLGLSRHSGVAEAAIRAIHDAGTSARAARHLAGSCREHAALEKALADWKGTEAALVFSSGYQTPLGVIPSLVGPQDTVLLERNAHACLFDGAKLSGARLRLFLRNSQTSLEEALLLTQKLNPEGKILVVAESLHSMDGDFLEIETLVELKEKYGAWLLLDEAHANGVIGPAGTGWAAERGLMDRIDIQMGTLGKSLGSSGGFVAASSEAIEHFLNEARTFLFGTAPAPAAMAAAAKALQILSSAEGENLRKQLKKNILLYASLHLNSRQGPVQPWILKSNDGTVQARDLLLARGIDVAAIRPPTVPEGSARLRISLSARHSEAEVQRLAEELKRLPVE